MMKHLPVFIILVPMFSALFLPIISKINKNFCWFFTFVGAGLSFLLSFLLFLQVRNEGVITYWLSNWRPPWGIEYRIDGLNSFVLLVITGTTFLSAIYAKESIEKELPKEKQGIFYCLFMLLLTGMSGIIITGDVFNLYVFLEIAALSGYALVAMGKNPRADFASFHYLILGTIGATFYLLGVGYLYITTGSLNMMDLQKLLAPLYNNSAVQTGFIFITLGLSIKLAVFPFHTWQPKAYGEAPSVVSALLAATGTKVAAYAFIRLVFVVFTIQFSFNVVPFKEFFTVVALVSMIAGSVLALSQKDIKKMLAYSSMGQIGYILLGITIGSERAITGSLLHILNHAIMKGGLFFVAGAVFYRIGSTKISDYKGLGRKMPLTAISFFIAACSMAGVPGTAGFISKWYLGTAALDAGLGYVIPFLLLSSLLTCVYFWRILNIMFFDGEVPTRKIDAPIGMLIPTVASAVLCLILGIIASPSITVARSAAEKLLEVM